MRCELEGFGPIPLATAFRLACDCSVTRVLMRGESEVLDLGRSTRLASAAQHKALAIRDRGCVFPGCDRPPAWCNAHHLVWWEHGGLTDEQNLCLLCRRHHTLCHEGGWGLTRNDDGTYEATNHPPATSHPTTRTRTTGARVKPGSVLIAAAQLDSVPHDTGDENAHGHPTTRH